MNGTDKVLKYYNLWLIKAENKAGMQSVTEHGGFGGFKTSLSNPLFAQVSHGRLGPSYSTFSS